MAGRSEIEEVASMIDQIRFFAERCMRENRDEAEFILENQSRNGCLTGGFAPPLDNVGEPSVLDPAGARIILAVNCNRQLEQLAKLAREDSGRYLAPAVGLYAKLRTLQTTGENGRPITFEKLIFNRDGTAAARSFQAGADVLSAQYQGQYGFGAALTLLQTIRALQTEGSEALLTLSEEQRALVLGLQEEVRGLLDAWHERFYSARMGSYRWMVLNDARSTGISPPGVDSAALDGATMYSNDGIQYNTRLIAAAAEVFGSPWIARYDEHVEVLRSMLHPKTRALRENVIRDEHDIFVDVPVMQNASYPGHSLTGLAHGVQTQREVIQHALYKRDTGAWTTKQAEIAVVEAAEQLLTFLRFYRAIDLEAGILGNTADLNSGERVAWPPDSWASEVWIETLLLLAASHTRLGQLRLEYPAKFHGIGSESRTLAELLMLAIRGRDELFGFNFEGRQFYGTEAVLLIDGAPFSDWSRQGGAILRKEELASLRFARDHTKMSPQPFVQRTNHHIELAEAAGRAVTALTGR